MSPRELVRSTPLRLAGAFALAIVLLTGGIFAFVYQATTQAWISQLQTVFADEAEKAAASDDERLKRALSLRLTRDFRRLNFVALYDPAGTLVFGNLDHKPDIPADGRTRYLADFRPTETGEPEPTLLVARARPNGDVIVLGRSLRRSRFSGAFSRAPCPSPFYRSRRAPRGSACSSRVATANESARSTAPLRKS